MRTTPYHHGTLPADLIDQAAAIVESEGPAAVTIARVASACGVSVAAPYRHFASKEALLNEVAGRGFRQLGEKIRAITADVSEPTERLIAGGVGYVRFAQAHAGLFGLMFSLEHRDAGQAAGPQVLAGLRESLEALPLVVPVEIAVRTAWALVHGLAMLRVGGMRTFTDDTDQRLREELSVLLSGVIAGPGHDVS